jgi:hypothetical protein
METNANRAALSMTPLDRLLRVPGVRGAVYRIAQAGRHGGRAVRAGVDYARLELRTPARPPAITAVVVGRNDDYMPDFMGRLRATLRWNLRYLVSDIVFVEWNPPADRPLLSPGLAREFASLTAYVVPAQVHRAICENPNLALLEYHAKNVGIRRAPSDWILVTNGDAAVGLDTVRRLRAGRLRDGEVWTAERHDVRWDGRSDSGLRLRNALGRRRVVPYRALGTGEFALASKTLWEQAGGYDESRVRHRMGCDTRGVAQMAAHGATIRRAGSVLHLDHDTSCTVSGGPHHGETAGVDGVPYLNPDDWGLAGAEEVEIAERVCELRLQDGGDS